MTVAELKKLRKEVRPQKQVTAQPDLTPLSELISLLLESKLDSKEFSDKICVKTGHSQLKLNKQAK